MGEQDLTVEQHQVKNIALSEFLKKKKKINDSSQLSFSDKEDELLDLALSFLENHKEFAFRYDCSGRGLPASVYYNCVKLLKHRNSQRDVQSLVNNEYMSLIQKNVDHYQELIRTINK